MDFPLVQGERRKTKDEGLIIWRIEIKDEITFFGEGDHAGSRESPKLGFIFNSFNRRTPTYEFANYCVGEGFLARG